MHDAPTFLFDVAMVTMVAAITGAIARAFKQPSILGYLFAGLLVGPSIPVPLFADPARTEALAEFGVVLVMFAVGLEFRFSRLAAVLPRSGFAAAVQIGVMGWLGVTVGMLLGWGAVGASFLGASLAISSTMVVSSIFAQQSVDGTVREHVLGILVVQDVVAIVLMATMTALAAGQEVEPAALGTLLLKLVGLLGVMLGGGILVVPRLVRGVLRVGGAEATTVLAVGLAFAFASFAELAGFSVALGAFVAGMLAAESGRGRDIEHAIEPLKAVFASIFFVSIGMAVDPWVAVVQLPLALLLSALVILGQLGAVTMASVLSGTPLRKALLAGFALGQIGELSFILASIGEQGGVVPDHLLPALVTVATITAFTTPWLLTRGEAWATSLDHRLPPRAARLLAMAPVIVERLREQVDPGFRRAMQGVVIDAAALLLLVAVTVTVGVPAGEYLGWGHVIIDLAAVLLAVPLVAGLLLNARNLARIVARRTADELLGAPLIQATVHLLLVLGVGFPALALLRPLIRGPWAEPLLALAVGLAVFLVWRSAGQADEGLRSGAEGLAHRLAVSNGPSDGITSLVPGLDHVVAVLVHPEFAGRTLAQIDLRARTGAIVVAIHRVGAPVVLPTGHEPLAEGDVLALTGAEQAIAQATALLSEATAPT